MTVRIAAFCKNQRSIVTVSDTKISFGDYSADDLAVKIEPLVPNWWVLMSGSDITGIPFIFKRSKELLQYDSVHDSYSVPRRLQMACVERLHQQIQSEVLDRYALTLAQFASEGAKILSAELYTDLTNKISQIQLPLQLMVVGFDSDGLGHIVRLDGISSPNSFDAVGFCAIGSGGTAALSSLLFHADRQNLTRESSEHYCIYCCCDAKFMSESASDVGRSTFLSILEHNKPPSFISGRRIETEIRPVWERLGAPRVPASLLKAIPEMIFDVDHLKADWSDFDFERVVGRRGPKKERMSYANRIKEFKGIRRALGQQPNPNGQDSLNPQWTKDAPSNPPPSPESPEGSDVS